MAAALSQVNTDGEYLDTDNLYYALYDSDGIMELTGDLFPGIGVPHTLTPYNHRSDYMMMQYGVCSIYFEFDWENPGIQLVYVDENGDEYPSEIAWNETSAVEEISAARQPVEVIYTDLAGRRISRPEHGFYITTTLYSDGTTISRKCLK